MNEIVKCLCGAEPIIERKPLVDNIAIDEVFKYKCPNCKEKELPWTGQWHDSEALQNWNKIALKRSYHRRMLEYNINGVCISKPFKVFEWVNKNKPWQKVTINFYLDNSMYYYCFDYMYLKHGHGFGLSINAPCFPSLEIAKRKAKKELLKSDKNLKKIIEQLFAPVQGELFYEIETGR